jgi:hypothetical protein
MICPHCKCFFCDDGADLIILGRSPKRFCRPECAKYYKLKRSNYYKKKMKLRGRRKDHARTLKLLRENPHLSIQQIISHKKRKKHYLDPLDAVKAYLELIKDRGGEVYLYGGIYYCCDLGWQISRDVRSPESKEE